MTTHQIKPGLGSSFMATFLIIINALLMRTASSMHPDETRAHCINAFELAFPKHQWTSENDIRAFTSNVSTEKKADSFFACPYGGGPGSELRDFDGSDLFDWFVQMFNPNKLKYTEIIMSEVSVANNVCSMDKLFFASLGNNCHVHAMSRLMIEVDEDGKLVKWLDHYDQEDLNQKMGVCNLQLEGNDEL